MRILFFTDNFPPEVNAPASRTYDHAREWVKIGHDVTIITCVPNFPKGRIFSGYKNKLWQVEIIDGIRVVRVWTYIAANEGFLKRFIDYLSFMISSFIASFFIRKIDLIVGTSPQFFTIVAAWLGSVFKRVPFVFELRDLWPESIRAVGAVKNVKILNLFEKLEYFMYHRADAIICVTNSFKTHLILNGISDKKIHVVTNGVDISSFSSRDKDGVLLSELGLSGQFIVGYIGTHGLAHALDTIVTAAKYVQQNPNGQRIHFMFVGDGAEKKNLKKLALESGLTNISFIDIVPKEQIARYWSIMDLAIVHLKKTKLFETVIPSKIFESMAMGVPMLYGVKGESAEIIQLTGTGILVEPENAHEMANQIVKLSRDSVTLNNIKLNSQAAAANFDRAILASNLLDILVELRSKNR